VITQRREEIAFKTNDRFPNYYNTNKALCTEQNKQVSNMSQYAYTQDAETNAKKTAINTNRITIL